MVLEIIRRRLIQQRRAGLVADVAQARSVYRSGLATRGNAADLLADLDS